MVDVDRISCIFGSFARRKPGQEFNAKRRIVHDRSKSAPHQTKKNVSPSQRAKSAFVGDSFDEGKFKCPMCRNKFEETRVLPCLHTFCLKCVLKLEEENGGSRTGSSDSRRHKKLHPDETFEMTKKTMSCPTCGVQSEIPPGGAHELPPNYPLQHKMVLATMNSKSTHLLCDLCVVDKSATSRCMDCAISFCKECEEVHLRQKFSAGHEVLSLDDAREKGITKVRRRIMCSKHPDLELSLFCNTCCDVICHECIMSPHKDHNFDSIPRIANVHLNQIRSAAHRTRYVVAESSKEAARLHNTLKDVEDHCNAIQEEVERFMDGYLKAVAEHKETLLEKIRQFKNKKMDCISEEKIKLQKRLRDARDLGYFLDDLLNDGADAEILSFLKPVMQKIKCCEDYRKPPDCNLLGNLQFVTNEIMQSPKHNYSLYGEITTQSVVPELCTINTEALQDIRIGEEVEVLLKANDEHRCVVKTGGESVCADVVHIKNGTLETYQADVVDNMDGTYSIRVLADVPGKYAVHVQIQNRPIQGSPHTFVVHPVNAHTGSYHCCSFCSSGGSKQAAPCGCGGHMPGGYRGCGHGHEGHPGQWHWSCCGMSGEYSECALKHYQFTL